MRITAAPTCHVPFWFHVLREGITKLGVFSNLCPRFLTDFNCLLRGPLQKLLAAAVKVIGTKGHGNYPCGHGFFNGTIVNAALRLLSRPNLHYLAACIFVGLYPLLAKLGVFGSHRETASARFRSSGGVSSRHGVVIIR